MDQGPLVREQIDAGRQFLTEFEKQIPVQAAFWLKQGEEGRWDLYVASDQIDDQTIKVAYREVLRVAGQMRDPNFGPFQVKAIGIDDPFAQAALDVLRRYPGRVAAHFHNRIFGGVGVEEVYIYPSPIPVS